jgi:hypothetical protein
MSKQTKMWLGIALIGVAGYMLFKGSNKASFVANTPTTKQKL